MHYEQNGSRAFVFDLMEPEGPKVDRRFSRSWTLRSCVRRISRYGRMGWCG